MAVWSRHIHIYVLFFFHLPVSALSAVEKVHLLLLLRSSSAHVLLVGICLGVHNASRLAESRDAGAMPETDLV